MLIIGSKSLSHIEILYICSKCSNRQACNSHVVVSSLLKDLSEATFLDRCDNCDTYFELKDAVFIAIEGPEGEHNI